MLTSDAKPSRDTSDSDNQMYPFLIG